MAHRVEVVLGWRSSRFAEVARRLEIGLPLSDEEREDPGPRDRREHLSGLLEAAHRAALEDLGFRKREGWKYATPLGDREFRPFRARLLRDPVKTRGTPDRAVYGVPLSGRQTPVLLDWREAGEETVPVWFDEELRNGIAVARRRIEERIPFFSTADVAVVPVSY